MYTKYLCHLHKLYHRGWKLQHFKSALLRFIFVHPCACRSSCGIIYTEICRGREIPLKRLIALTILLLLLASMLSGCFLSESDADPDVEPINSAPGTPLVDEPVTFTYWITFPYMRTSSGVDYNSSVSFREMERQTGVHVNFIHPAAGNEYNEYKLMMVSRDLPDLVYNPGEGYPGGIEAAIENGIFVPLNTYIEEYAPNYLANIVKNEQRLRSATTDNGYYAAFWQINDPEQGPWFGPVVRKDWLDKVGLDIPTTVGEWEEMLRAFRDVLGSETPYKLRYNGVDDFSNILSAYGVGSSFYRVGNKVHFGPAEEGYFEYLSLMRSWYNEGIINPSFYNQRDTSYFNGLQDGVGAGGTMYTNIGLGEEFNVNIADPTVHTVGVPYPVINEGDKIHIRRYNPDIASANTSITTACTDIVTAVRWMDYGYSDEGAMILNFGVEGLTYEYIEDKPRFTDLIYNDPDGRTPLEAMRSYVSLHHPTRYYWWRELEFVSDEGMDAINNIWTKADAEYVLPPITLSSAEGREYEKRMPQIESYVTEMTVKIILRLVDINIRDEYMDKLIEMGLTELIRIQQVALDRYGAR